MILDKISRYWHTLRHLQARQICCRLRYTARRKLPFLRTRGSFTSVARTRGEIRLTTPSLPSSASVSPDNAVSLLNLAHRFGDRIDWNFTGLGSLWAYNLNYFDFLSHPPPGMSAAEGTRLIRAFIADTEVEGHAYDSHPVSVRIINWIKFLLNHDLRDGQIDCSLSFHCLLYTSDAADE